MTKTETLPQNLLLDYSELSDISEQDRQFANDYVESVRAAYRDWAEYRGRRTPEQIEIANQQSLKAENLIVDYLSAFNLTDHLDERVGGLENGLELKQMVDAWRHLWVGFAVITNRIARDDTRHKYNIKEISELNNKEYMLVMQKLFNDFQEHNALRFGSETAGVRRKKNYVNSACLYLMKKVISYTKNLTQTNHPLHLNLGDEHCA